MEEELGRAERMLKGIDIKTIMRDDLNTVCKVVTPEIDKIKQNVWNSLGKYYKFADPDANWEVRCRARLTNIQRKKDEITEEFVSSGGKQESSVALLHQDLKPFTGTESTSIFEYLKHVEIATHSMGNRSERSTMVINRYLDLKIKGQFAAFACRPYTELRSALIARFGKVPEIISRIQSSTLKASPPVMNAPPKDIHMHLVEIHTTLNRIQALRDLPEVNDAEVTQVIHARDFQLTFQSKWADWLGAEFTSEIVRIQSFDSADYKARYKSMLSFIETKMKAYDLIIDDLNAFKYAHPGEKKRNPAEKSGIKTYAAQANPCEGNNPEEDELTHTWNTHFSNSEAKFECVLPNHTGHNIYNCKDFLRMSPDERWNSCRGKKCFTCLGTWGTEHRRTCPKAKDLPKDVICASCNPTGERFPMNVLFCGRQGHKKPSPKVFLDAMKKYRPDMDTSAATEKIIKIMMSGKKVNTNHEPEEALNLRQTLVINGRNCNVYYDTGAAASLVCETTAQDLGLKRTGEEEVNITNLGETVSSKVGQFEMHCTVVGDRKKRSVKLQGIPDLQWDLAEVDLSKINEEVRGRKLGELPKQAAGGAVGIVLGIDRPELMPVLLQVLPSGAAVYRSAFRDKYGSDIVYGGCHDSFRGQTTTYCITGLMGSIKSARSARGSKSVPPPCPPKRGVAWNPKHGKKIFSSRVFVNSAFLTTRGNKLSAGNQHICRNI